MKECKNLSENKINEIKWDIISLSEVRKLGEDLMSKTQGFGQTKEYGGLGFGINNGFLKLFA